jgi:hypothetical protein
VLYPLSAHPQEHPESWAEAAARGPGTIAVVNIDNAPVGAPSAGPNGDIAGAIRSLAAAGVRPVGHVSLGYATRPIVDILGEIAKWSMLPVAGLFFDHAPAGPYQIGPVVASVRAARRAGLGLVVLNPGVPVDSVYRRLEATICTFEGSWAEYRDWSAAETAPGDGHLVFGVPRGEWGAARALIIARGAGLMLVTDRTTPYSGFPDPVAVAAR